jgi:ribosomal protein S18 acetylase RimI-like enzyme
MERTVERREWERILRVDELTHASFGERIDWPAVALFVSERGDSANLALIDAVAADEADEVLEAIVRFYRERGVLPRVRLTPLSQPEDWEERLAERGFRPAEGELFMALRGPLAGEPNPAVTIRRAPDEVDLTVVVATQMRGFGVTSPMPMSEEPVARALRNWPDYRYYAAFMEDVPAGAASARMMDGVAGIYGVATIDRFRRRGISTTLLHVLVDEARAEGCEIIYLSAEPDGYARRLYGRLGFEELFEVMTYELPYGT